MSEAKKLPKRDEVAENLTWDLTKIFKDDQAFEKAFSALQEKLQYADSYRGTLGDECTSIFSCI